MERRQWAENFYSNYFTNLNPNQEGECAVKCPWHDDNRESMSINIETGRFYCHACDIGGDEYEFYRIAEGYEKTDFRRMVRAIEKKYGVRPQSELEKNPQAETLDFEEEETECIDEREVMKSHRILMQSAKMLHFLLNKRGLRKETIEKYKIGYDVERITIPIYDSKGRCVNIRRYSPEAKGKAKMISFKTGSGSARLFPIENIKHDTILLTEGEMDCLLAIQMGYNAMTTTGGANTWRAQWNSLFKDKTVLICYDIDKAGQAGAEKVARNLYGIAKQVKIIKLPIVDPPDGDITDYFVALGHTKEDLDLVIQKTHTYVPGNEEPEIDPSKPIKVHLSQASHADYIDKKICMDVMVSGKDIGPYGYPKKLKISCTPDNGNKCAMCVVGVNGGERTVTFKDDDRSILQLIDCTDAQQATVIKGKAGIPKACNAFHVEVVEQGNLEEVILQPELDFSAVDRPYTTRVAYVIGHGLQANMSYRMKGITITDPRHQYVTHLISEAEPSQDNVSSFKMTPDKHERLKIFQPVDGQTVAEKFKEIYHDLTNNVTHIYGREDVLMAVDLVYHSVLAFRFQDQLVPRGWVEGLIIGDTRTGKSETAQSIMNHYKLGEFVTGENTTFAGLIGGMQQTQKRWFVSWGKIPLNDRRLVIIDEASGLSEEAIGNMSGVRSSGVAEIIKIHQERTHARTRLLWISNTRTGKALRQYGFGVEAVQELIGKNEDIARFEFVVSCASEEVSMDLINRHTSEIGQVPHIYTYDLCKQLVLWAWSRTEENIHFTDEATTLTLSLAKQMARDYVSHVPLVEGANQRIKLARLAVAIACRMYSTEDGVRVIVKPEHVQFAYDFLNQVFKKPSLGYWDLSQQIREQERAAMKAKDSVLKFLKQNQEVARVFLQYSYVIGKDLEDLCDLDSSTVRRYLKFLAKNGMIGKGSRGYVKQPAFIEILREGGWKTSGEEDIDSSAGDSSDNPDQDGLGS